MLPPKFNEITFNDVTNLPNPIVNFSFSFYLSHQQHLTGIIIHSLVKKFLYLVSNTSNSPNFSFPSLWLLISIAFNGFISCSWALLDVLWSHILALFFFPMEDTMLLITFGLESATVHFIWGKTARRILVTQLSEYQKVHIIHIVLDQLIQDSWFYLHLQVKKSIFLSWIYYIEYINNMYSMGIPIKMQV